jgi:hypothetical protein
MKNFLNRFRDPFVTTTDEQGRIWGQRPGSDRRPVLVSDPSYVPDWSAGEISDKDKALIGVSNGIAFTAAGGILLAIFCVAVGL